MRELEEVETEAYGGATPRSNAGASFSKAYEEEEEEEDNEGEDEEEKEEEGAGEGEEKALIAAVDDGKKVPKMLLRALA